MEIGDDRNGFLTKGESFVEATGKVNSIGRAKFQWAKFRWIVWLGLLLVVCGLAIPRWLSQYGFDRIRTALDRHDNVAALREIESLERWIGIGPESSLLAARAHRRLADTRSFERCLQRAKDLGGDPQRIQHEYDLQRARLGQLPELHTKIDALLEQQPDDFEESADAILRGLLLQQDIAHAVQLLVAWESESPDSPGVALFHGMLSLWRRDWKMAKERLEPAMSRHPDFVPYWLQLGIAYVGLREDESAERLLHRYLEKVPSDTSARLRYVDVLSRLGRGTEALTHAESLIQSGHRSTDLRLQAALLYLDQKQPERAIEILGRTASDWPEDAAIASAMSRAYALLENQSAADRFAEIAQVSQKALQPADAMYFALISDPQPKANACYELGHLLLHKQSRENGIYWLEAALRLDERHAGAHRDLAHYYRKTDQASLAQVHERYLETPPESP
jgi:tetratricopeptide (TPR) repeat protein